jgi:cytochrome c-type biogenesis protein CcmH/NrfG
VPRFARQELTSASRRQFLSGRGIGLAAILVAATVALYGQVYRFGFLVFDDPAYVSENRQVLAGLTTGGIRWAFTTIHDSNWIPLTWLSLMADASAYGTWAGGYHLTNLLLHAANVLLVFAAFGRMTGDLGRSAFVAALFAIHPLHVESVAWIAERKDVLSLFFGFVSLNAYVAYCKDRHTVWLVCAWLGFVCSLLAKQTLVTLPFVLLLLDFGAFGGRQFERIGRRVVEKIPFFLASAAFCVIAIVAQSHGKAMRPLTSMPLAGRCLNAVAAYGLYAFRVLIPTRLAPFYPYPDIQQLSVLAALSVAFLCAATWICIVHARKRPMVLVGWLWFLGALMPMIGLVQIGGQQTADRYVYFPAIGLYAAVAWLVPATFATRPLPGWLRPTAATVLVAIYSGLAMLQVGYWRDSVTLFRHALTVTDDNALSRLALGSALLERGQCEEAIVHLKRAAELDPYDGQVHFVLGSGFQQADCPREAAAEYRKSLALNERNGSAHNNLGLILYQQHCHAEARSEFLRAIDLDETDERALVNLALLTSDLHEYENSVAYCQRALELDPGLDVCRRLLTVAHGVQARLAETSRNGGFN